MAYNDSYIAARDIVIGATCVLSIVGAAAIILSYLLIREVRTSVRFLLFNLSIADLLAAVINLISIGYFYSESTTGNGTIDNTACQVTGGVGLFAADSSILWTIAVMVYLYISMACCRPSKIINHVVIALIMIFCWGVPAIIATVLIAMKFFGLPTGPLSTGFCTAVYNNKKIPAYHFIISYDVFLVSAFLILPLLSVGFALQMNHKAKRHAHHYYNHQNSLWRKAEMKLVFVAIAFILIRVWGLVTEIMAWTGDKKIGNSFHDAMFFLAGIGDSAQGFVNGVLFCLLTPGVRQRLFRVAIKYLCCGCFCCSNRGSIVNESLLHHDSGSSNGEYRVQWYNGDTTDRQTPTVKISYDSRSCTCTLSTEKAGNFIPTPYEREK